jgi:hypothetical protein
MVESIPRLITTLLFNLLKINGRARKITIESIYEKDYFLKKFSAM